MGKPRIEEVNGAADEIEEEEETWEPRHDALDDDYWDDDDFDS